MCSCADSGNKDKRESLNYNCVRYCVQYHIWRDNEPTVCYVYKPSTNESHLLPGNWEDCW